MPRASVVFTLALALCAPVVAASAQDATHPNEAAMGEHLFKQNCSTCHSTEPDKKIVGPSLHGELKSSGPHKTPEEVRSIIIHGKGAMPPIGMQLSQQEIDHLIAYLRTQ